MNNLTDREQQAYNFIIQYFKDNGFAPSYQEIADGIYYASQSSVKDVVESLQRKGYIEIPYKATPRAIRVVGMKHVMGE